MNTKLITRIIAFILALVLILGLIPMLTMAAEDGVVIKLHYNRPDGNYTDWSVWFWNYGQEGQDKQEFLHWQGTYRMAHKRKNTMNSRVIEAVVVLAVGVVSVDVTP